MTSKWHKGSGGPAGNETGLFVAQPFSPHGHYRYEASEHAATLQDRENRQGGHTHLVAQAFCKSKRAQPATDDETWVDDGLANTLNGFDTGDARTTHAIAFTQNQRDEVRELGDRAASLSGQGTHQTNYVAFTIDMQACKGNANVGDGSVSPTLCKPSGNDCHAVAIGMDAEFNARMEQMGTLKRGGEGGTQQCVAIGVDVYNGIETGDVAATVTSATGIANASGPKAIAFNWQNGGGYGNANDGLGITEEGTGPLQRCQTPAVAFKTGNSAKARSDGMSEEQSPTLGSNGGGNTVPAVAFNGYQRTEQDVTWPLGASDGRKVEVGVRSGMVVRRLTPVECERLQGFPDGWTDVGTPEKPTADSHRYKQLGNAVTVNVAEWLARRIRRCLEQ